MQDDLRIPTLRLTRPASRQDKSRYLPAYELYRHYVRLGPEVWGDAFEPLAFKGVHRDRFLDAARLCLSQKWQFDHYLEFASRRVENSLWILREMLSEHTQTDYLRHLQGKRVRTTPRVKQGNVNTNANWKFSSDGRLVR